MRGREPLLGGLLIAFAMAGPASGNVKPGDVITADNVARANGLISPGVEWCVRRGWPLRVVESQDVPLPKRYLKATEKYSPRVKLGPDGVALEGYVAGLPFPKIDANDPRAATKIMWNYEHRPAVTDDVDVRGFRAETGTIFAKQPLWVERHFLIDRFRVLRYAGRAYEGPLGLWQTGAGYQSKQGLYPILEPFDLKGAGAISDRYIDPARPDDTWLYFPWLRRVQWISAAQRGNAPYGQDADIDSAFGYSGHIAGMDWKYLGKKEALGAFHVRRSPLEWASPASWAFDAGWERRKVHVIEGRAKMPTYPYAKRILYVDEQTWAVPYSDVYDRAGMLWKVWINRFDYDNKRPRKPKQSHPPSGVPFLPAIVMVDVQLNRATRASLPPERWTFNTAKDRLEAASWFTLASLSAGGR